MADVTYIIGDFPLTCFARVTEAMWWDCGIIGRCLC